MKLRLIVWASAIAIATGCGSQAYDVSSRETTAPERTSIATLPTSQTRVAQCDSLVHMDTLPKLASWSTHAVIVEVLSEAEGAQDPELPEVARQLSLAVERNLWSAPSSKLRVGEAIEDLDRGAWVKEGEGLVPMRCQDMVRPEVGRRYVVFLMEDGGTVTPLPAVSYIPLDGNAVSWPDDVQVPFATSIPDGQAVTELAQAIGIAERDSDVVRTEGRGYYQRLVCEELGKCNWTSSTD